MKTFEISTIRGRLSKLFKTVSRSHHARKPGHTQKRDEFLSQKANLAASDYVGLTGKKFISTYLKAKHVRQIMSEESMTEQNKEDSNEENRPLTRSDWVMLLSGEINNEEGKSGQNMTFTIAFISIFLVILTILLNLLLNGASIVPTGIAIIIVLGGST